MSPSVRAGYSFDSGGRVVYIHAIWRVDFRQAFGAYLGSIGAYVKTFSRTIIMHFKILGKLGVSVQHNNQEDAGPLIRNVLPAFLRAIHLLGVLVLSQSIYLHQLAKFIRSWRKSTLQ